MKRRLILGAVLIAAVAVASAGAWMVVRDDEQTRRGGIGLGSLPNTCPPWAPNLRVNAFGKKYCSAYNAEGQNTGRWASNLYKDYERDYCPPRGIRRAYVANINDCCPDWAPILRWQFSLVCSRLDDDSTLFQYDDPDGIYRGLYTAPPPPPKP